VKSRASIDPQDEAMEDNEDASVAMALSPGAAEPATLKLVGSFLSIDR
jgi:hypothetical protein